MHHKHPRNDSDRSGASLWLIVFALVALLAAMVVSTRFLRADEKLNDRRERVAVMSPADKDKLLRLEERFAAMSADQQDALRKLHAEIEQDPDSAELRRVMRRYRDWYETLPVEYRTRLAQLPSDERLALVTRLRNQELDAQSKQLSEEDATALKAWLVRRWQKRDRHDRREDTKKRFEDMSTDEAFLRIFRELRWRNDRPTPIREEGLADLESMLSQAARDELAKAQSVDEKRQLVGHWIRDIYGNAMRAAWEEWRRIDEDELAEFFKTLPPDRRDELMDMPPIEMQRELRRDFYSDLMEKLRGRGPGRGDGPIDERRSRSPGPGDHPPRPGDRTPGPPPRPAPGESF